VLRLSFTDLNIDCYDGSPAMMQDDLSVTYDIAPPRRKLRSCRY